MDPEIHEDFPGLTGDNHKETSPRDFNYNCLAFAVGDLNNWWEPPSQFGNYWPPGFPEDVTVETAVAILRVHGYGVEAGPGSDPGGDAVAIFAESGE